MTFELLLSKQIHHHITMPTGEDIKVSAEGASQAVVVAPLTGDLEGDLPPLPPLKMIWGCSKVEKGPTVSKNGKTEG